ncbi:TF isoform 4 [Pan troglodytes]|uniref:Transferrin n=2 Tax=Homininae TaxID=207598 RepID=F8WEK9_HUMAN|nr:transferrin [Homo sapiens]KAI4031631.1 transferrin [Homo sapiens]PNI96207.1 TF isoform 4 [Pan troglodytes]
MRLAVGALLVCAVLGLCLAVPDKTVRWCAVSEHEATKCQSFRDHMKSVIPSDGPSVACVKKASYLDCIRAIAVSRCCLKESGRKPYFLCFQSLWNNSLLTGKRSGCCDTGCRFGV